MSNRGAGGAAGSLRSSSRARGQSVAADVRPTTSPNDLAGALEALTVKPRNQSGSRCRVAEVLSTLDPATAERLATLIDEPRPDGGMVSASDISATLQDAGYDLGLTSISRHRRRKRGLGCRCA